MVVRFNHSCDEDKWEGERIAVGDHPGVLWFPSAGWGDKMLQGLAGYIDWQVRIKDPTFISLEATLFLL